MTTSHFFYHSIDPILPEPVYEAVLQSMLSEVEGVLSTSGDMLTHSFINDQVLPQMMTHFLSTLIAWGPTRSLQEKIQFHSHIEDARKAKNDTDDILNQAVLRDAEQSLDRRRHQTSSNYLQFPSSNHPEPLTSPSTIGSVAHDTEDSLFSVNALISKVSSHVPILDLDTNESDGQVVANANNQAALEALAELYMMKGEYKMALKAFLAIGLLHVSPDLVLVEDNAIQSVNGAGKFNAFEKRHGFVVAMVEYQHLHQCLLDDNFLNSLDDDEREKIPNPLVAFIQLVGLDDAGEFLVEHCVPPPVTRPTLPLSPQSRSSSANIETEYKNGNESLPINVVADKLRPHPKLFHWYLHQIFTKRPEVYVKFPRTAVPPRSVTELHRSHLELYIEYTDKRDSVKALSGTETYNLERMTTPLLSFLKVRVFTVTCCAFSLHNFLITVLIQNPCIVPGRASTWRHSFRRSSTSLGGGKNWQQARPRGW